MVFLGYVLLAKTLHRNELHNPCNFWEQDIQLVISDPKACNIIFKDQAIFDMSEVGLR